MRQPRGAWLLAVLVVSACAAPASQGGGGTAGTTPAPERIRSALETSGLADYLPRTAPVIVAISRPQTLAMTIGLSTVLDSFDELRQVRAKIVDEVGVDLLVPERWSKIGLDADKPLGFALLDAKMNHGVFAAGVSDADKMIEWLRQLHGKVGRGAFEVRTVGDARSVTIDDGVFVFRDEWVFLVAGDTRDGVALYAETIATAVRESSLGAKPAYEQTIRDLSFGSAAATWWDLSALFTADGEDKLAAQLSTLTLGVELRDRAVETRVAVGLPATGGLRDVWDGHEAVPAMVRTSAEVPFFLLSAAINVGAAIEFGARQSGVDSLRAREDFKSAVGIDLDKEILPLVTGEVGFAIYLNDELYDRGSREEAFGGTLLLGLHDGAAARARIHALLARPAFGLQPSADGSHYSTPPLPNGKPIHIGVAGNSLVFTSRLATFDEVARGGPSFADSVASPGLARVLASPDVAAVAAVDLAGASSVATSVASSPADLFGPAPELPLTGPAGYAEKLGEVQQLRKTLEKQSTELTSLRARVRDLGGRWGVLAGTMLAAEGGVRLEGGVYLAPHETLRQVAADTIRFLGGLEHLDRDFAANRDKYWQAVGEARAMVPSANTGGTN